MIELATATCATFLPYTGKNFKLTAGNGECQLLLKDATESKHDGPKRQPFSLLFSAPVGVHIEQGTYTLEHENAGTLEIFLVPIGMEDGVLELQAVFN